MIMKGPFPQRKHEISVRGHSVEWRGNGYSVIHGRHPEGMDYMMIADLPKWLEAL
jgi:hypothetical protein